MYNLHFVMHEIEIFRLVSLIIRRNRQQKRFTEKMN